MNASPAHAPETPSGHSSFVEAAEKARLGRHAEATALLEAARAARDCSEVEALDLQARMLAQQGRYLEAEGLWRRCREIDGGNPAYDDALARLRARARPGRRLAAGVLGAILISLIAAWAGRDAALESRAGSELMAARAALDAVREDVHSLKSRSMEAEEALARQMAEWKQSVELLARQRAESEEQGRQARERLAGNLASLAKSNAQLRRRLNEVANRLDSKGGAVDPALPSK